MLMPEKTTHRRLSERDAEQLYIFFCIAIYLRPLLWQAKLDHLIHAVFLHWAIAMQASRQKDLRGDISWVHSVLQWSHIRVRRVAKIDHFWGVLVPSRLLGFCTVCCFALGGSSTDCVDAWTVEHRTAMDSTILILQQHLLCRKQALRNRRPTPQRFGGHALSLHRDMMTECPRNLQTEISR